MDMSMSFKFESLKGFGKKKVRKEILPDLLGVTISSARGIIYTRTKGEKINKFFLPILNPTQLIQEKYDSVN